MSKQQQVLKDRIYKLKRRITPLSYMLQSKSSRRKPLLYFDGTSNRPLRYSRNQRSPFQDEQDGNAILEPIIFEDGYLYVQKSNPVLQEFLSYHPGFGTIFVEVDNERDASEDVETLDYELEAQLQARDLDLETLETVCRVLLNSRVEKMTTAEMKRDVRMFAKRNPIAFLDALNDPILSLQNLAAKLFVENIVTLKNNKRDIYYNLPSNNKKLMTVPFGEEPTFIVASYFQTDEGIDVMKILENKLKNMYAPSKTKSKKTEEATEE